MLRHANCRASAAFQGLLEAGFDGIPNGLRELGNEEGRDFVIERRYDDARQEADLIICRPPVCDPPRAAAKLSHHQSFSNTFLARLNRVIR